MLTDNVFDCHVLVIGSGGAGMRAAVSAAEYGSVILLSRSLTGKGGCTVMAEGGYNAVLNPADSKETHINDTMRGGAYLNDPELVRILVDEAPDRIADLISWGAVFDTAADESGKSTALAQRPFGGQSYPRTCYAGDTTGHEIMAALMERVRTLDVEIMEETCAIDFIYETTKNVRRICGAAALNKNGELIIIRADAVVLASGGSGQLYDVCTNCATGNGQGYAMAYRAGAELIDMEMVQFHPTGAVYPYDARGRLITEAVRGEGGILKNKNAERFMSRYSPEKMELSTRDVVARSIASEIQEGRGTDKGGVYLDVSHLPPEQIEKKLPLMLEQFLKYGVDIRKEPIEAAPTAHHMMGGVRITPECASTIPGLFACGEVTGGVHGANRLGGNSLADTQVFGKRAGESAGKTNLFRARLDSPEIIGQTAAISFRLDRFKIGRKSVYEVKNELKKIMWENAGIFRTKQGLEKALFDIDTLKRVRTRASNPEELIECCVVEDMLLTAELIVKAALLREESRGAHTRTDIEQDWTAENSPFGHTCLSETDEYIEIKEDTEDEE